MFGLGKLIYVVILVINGIAVLSEDRFLNRIGWGSTTGGQADQYGFSSGGDNSDTSVKTKLINLISAIRTLLRVPLIAINIIVIVYELILG